MRTGIVRLLFVALALLLAACGSSAPEPVYAPLAYTYLKPLRLDVGSIEIVDDWAPGPEDVGAIAPVSPVDALRRMAQDRLAAAGTAGRAVFHIEDAALRRAGDMVTGDLGVRLEIVGPDGAPGGYAAAHVARSAFVSEDAPRAELYALVGDMMRDMNVEFEYQVRQHLRRWLQEASAPGSAIPPPVEQQPLPPPTQQRPAPPAGPPQPPPASGI